MTRESNVILRSQDVHKSFDLGHQRIEALRGVTAEVRRGDFMAIAGASGSGKTTLLNLFGCLDVPTAGEIFLNGNRIREMSSRRLAHLRARHLGFVFQTFNLLPVLSALENVEYPLNLLGAVARQRRERACAALARVGLEKFAHHRPDQMSGGQRQRVAIARALVKTPQLILADEPTANLDSGTAAEVLDLLQDLNRREGLTVVLSSHDEKILQRASWVLRLRDGKAVES